MCLKTDKKLTEEWLASKKNCTRKVVVYKVLKLNSGYLRNWLSSPYRSMVYKPGVHKSNSRTHKICMSTGRKVRKGIHCFLTFAEAQKLCNNAWGLEHCKIVKVYADVKDLIAVGYFIQYQSIVFKKVTLTQHEYDKAVKGGE